LTLIQVFMYASASTDAMNALAFHLSALLNHRRATAHHDGST
jgi:hypothetical protein